MSDQSPLVSMRPGEASGKNSAEVPARLWQDPLGIPAPSKPHADLSHRIQSGRRVLVLPVLLNGNAYPETKEVRLRSRFAVHAALSRAQYVPVNAENLQFLAAPEGTSVDPFPFEEFEVRYVVADGVAMTKSPLTGANTEREILGKDSDLLISNRYDQIFVLWLDENALSRAPAANSDLPAPFLISRLDRLLTAILSCPASAVTDIKIIGPSSSDRLVDLVDRQPPAKEVRVQNTSAIFLSPRATAPTDIVKLSLTRDDNFAELAPYDTPAWPVYRTILPDDQLVQTLLEELRRRNVSPGDQQDIVLIGEWDSLYSRGIGRTIAAHLHIDLSKEKLVRRDMWEQTPRFFHEFSYLRGLDGRLPKDTRSARKPAEAPAAGQGRDAAAEEKESAPASARAADTNRAAGESQFDYLRRLEDRLLELQSDLQRGAPDRGPDHTRGAPSEIAAIGIVGSDVYDKLIVLRALRKSFPRAVFFTTDLDASYLDREEREWTRNLVIVAPHGLRAANALQGRTPPFRDSYQTALFLTCLEALGVTKVRDQPFTMMNDGAADRKKSYVQHPPRIFEIGRSRISDLSTETSLIHPDKELPFLGHWRSRAALVLFGTAALAAFIWCWCVRSAFYRNDSGGPLQVRPSSGDYLLSWVLSAVWFVATAGFVAASVHTTRNPDDAANLAFSQRAWLAALTPLYVWTFYRIFQMRSTPGQTVTAWDRFAIFLFGMFTLGGVIGFSTTLQGVMHGTDEEPFALFEGVSVWPTAIVRALVIGFSVSFILRAQFQLTEMKAGIAARFPRLADKDASNYELPPMGWKSLRPLNWPGTFWLPAPGRCVPASAQRAADDDKEKALWQDYCKIATVRSRFPRIVTYMVFYGSFFFALGGIFEQPIVPVRGEWSRALDQGVLATAVLVYVYLLFYVFDATLLASEFIKRLGRYIGEHSKLGEDEAIHLVNDLVAVVGRLIYLPFSVLFMMIASRNSLFDRWDWPATLLGVFGSGLILIVVATIKLQHAASGAKAAALDYIDGRLRKLARTNARLAMPMGTDGQRVGDKPDNASAAPFGGLAQKQLGELVVAAVGVGAGAGVPAGAPAPDAPGTATAPKPREPEGRFIEDLTDAEIDKAHADAIKRRQDELREQRRQIDAFDNVAFQGWRSNPIFRAVLIPVGGIGSLQLLEKIVGMLPA